MIRCKNCGAQLPDNAKFCQDCKTPVPEDAVIEKKPESPVKASAVADFVKNNKALIKKGAIAVAAIVVVIIAVCIIASLFKPSQYIKTEQAVLAYNEDDETVVIWKNGDEIKLDGEYYGIYSNLDGTKGAVMIREEDGDDDYVRNLYDFDGKLIAEDVYKAVVSVSGDGILVVRDVEDEDFYELLLWDGKKLKTVVDELTMTDGITISPDGKTVAYATGDVDDEDEDDDFVGYYYDGKKSHELGKNIRPVAISNGAKQVYYIKDSGLYVQKKDNKDDRVKLANDSDIDDIAFNCDMTEILFNVTDDEGNDKSYISADGKEKVKLKNSVSDFIVPEGVASAYSGSAVLGVRTFENTYYYGSGNIYRIGKNFESVRVTDSSSDVSLADDGKTLIYRDGDSIFKMDGTKEESEPKRLVEDEVDTLIGATAKGDAFFYINEDEELMYQKGTKKPTRITDEFDDYAYSLFKGTTVFYTVDDEVYYSNGKKGEAVKGIDIDSVSAVHVFDLVVRIMGEYDDESVAYISADGKKFTLVEY